MLYGRPEFESRLGNPEEALHRADAVRITGVVPGIYEDNKGSIYKYFIYRRPTLYPLEIAVDFFKSP